MEDIWLATDGQKMWVMEHEADYVEGNTLIHVEVEHKHVKLTIISEEDHEHAPLT